MADILIRGFEMPTTGNYFAMVENEPNHEPNVTIWKRKADGGLESFGFGEIVELPEHGDLIDRDAFRAENEYYLNREFINPKYEDTLDDLLKDAPVVIPSNKEDAE